MHYLIGFDFEDFNTIIMPAAAADMARIAIQISGDESPVIGEVLSCEGTAVECAHCETIASSLVAADSTTLDSVKAD